MNKVSEHIGLKILDFGFTLSSEELQSLGVNERQYLTNLKNGTIQHRCSEYALHRLKEPRIIPWIVGAETKQPFLDVPIEQSIELLESWGYTQVLEPLRGDLIAYIDDRKNEIVHFGVFETPTQVISKWGVLPVFSHPIERISNAYGVSSYLCFRKESDLTHLNRGK